MKIKILFILSLSFTVCSAYNPPPPGIPPPVGFRIDQDILGLFVAGILFGLYWIRKAKKY